MTVNQSIEIRQSSNQYPLVTIAIPTYKREKFLREALDSALYQVNFDNYEVLVCDNNPIRYDGTETLISTYNDSKLSYYKNTVNLGMVGNWNQLYKLAKGEWVVMLHDDDLLSSFFLEYIFIKKTLHKKGDLIFPDFTLNKLKFQKSNIYSKRKILFPKIWDFLASNLIGPPIGMTMKKEIFNEIGCFSMRFYPSQDYAFYVEAILHNRKIIRLYGDPMAFCRIEVNESLRPEIQIGFVKNQLEIGQYITAQYISKFKLFLKNINYLSSYNLAKTKLKQYPDNNDLKNIIKFTKLNFYNKIIANFFLKIILYRRKVLLFIQRIIIKYK